MRGRMFDRSRRHSEIEGNLAPGGTIVGLCVLWAVGHPIHISRLCHLNNFVLACSNHERRLVRWAFERLSSVRLWTL